MLASLVTDLTPPNSDYISAETTFAKYHWTVINTGEGPRAQPHCYAKLKTLVRRKIISEAGLPLI